MIISLDAISDSYQMRYLHKLFGRVFGLGRSRDSFLEVFSVIKYSDHMVLHLVHKEDGDHEMITGAEHACVHCALSILSLDDSGFVMTLDYLAQ